MADEPPFYSSRLRAHESLHRRPPRDAREGETRRHPYHPAPGIVVDVVDAQGGATASEVQRVARSSGYWPLRQCYEEGLRNDQRLSGKVSLEMIVSPEGGVDRSAVVASTVRDDLVSACVAREARRLRFKANASPTTAKVDVLLAVGDEPVPSPRSVPDAEALREALRASWDAARQCYANVLSNRPDVGGRLEVRFRSRKDADIFDIAETGDHDVRFPDADVTRCVLGVYRAAKLPALRRGLRDHAFVYALRFESKPEASAAP